MSDGHPFITVGIASYNYAQFLPRAFEAVRRQGFRDFELLYADDGSTDGSLQLIRELIARHPDMDIRLVEGENLGVMGNKQRLLDHARGEYIMLCDADDWMDDNCLEVLAAEAKRSGADRIVTEIRNVDGEGKALYTQRFSKNPSKWCEALHHGALYRMALIRDHGIRMGNVIPDDFCFISEFNAYAEETRFLRHSVYNWRVHEASASRKNREKNEWRGSRLLKNILAFQAEICRRLPGRISPRDREELQLHCVKNYYYYIINDAARMPRAQSLAAYGEMRDLMREYEPDYLKNRYLNPLIPGPLRPSVHLCLSALSMAERMGCMPAALAVLRLAARFR